MRRMLMVESAAQGLLTVNGQFCGPLEGEGQAFPLGENAQAYIQFVPYDSQLRPLAAALEIKQGKITRLDPQAMCCALSWPDGMIQLELCPDGGNPGDRKAEEAPPNTLLRYLMMRLAGDPQAQLLLMRAQDDAALDGYEAAVPLRFGPAAARIYDERAGLVRRTAPNAAVVDAVLAATVPAGQGRKMIERMEIVRT